VKAYDFPKCSDNSCLKECSNGTLRCAPVRCGGDPSDNCLYTPPKPEPVVAAQDATTTLSATSTASSTASKKAKKNI
jgi:hypothetical protein